MASIKNFEDMIAWQRARELNKDLHALFRNCRDFSFKDQLFRASVSIMNNIAEGFERSSDKEFRQFLNIAKGSAGEIRSMLYLALDFSYISSEDFKQQSASCAEISKMLAAFMKHLQPVIL